MSLLNTLPENAGVIICGHGSRAKIAEEEFSLLTTQLRVRYPQLEIEYGFLEYSSPNIHMALDRLIDKGVTHIYAVPGMLFSATHAQNDIPSVLITYSQKNPALTIQYGEALGLHPEMILAFQHRIMEAINLGDRPKPGDLYDTMLVVVGRGTSVAEANAEATKLTRIVAENMGFGWCETVYSGVTFPSVGRGLEMALKLGFKKIVVAPYFLFSGKLIGRINAYVGQVATENPDVAFYTADYLRDQTHVINSFVERIEETVSQPVDNHGLMEKFQSRLAAREVTIHHHHAEYQPEHKAHSQTHDHSHHHGEAHRDSAHTHSNHSHSHEPYRHIAHPHGPRTMIDENVCCCFMSQFPQSVIEEERALRQQQGKSAIEPVPQCQSEMSIRSAALG